VLGGTPEVRHEVTHRRRDRTLRPRHRDERGHQQAHADRHGDHELIVPERRAAFLADPEQAFERAGLTSEERETVRGRQWRAMIHYGVIFFMLEKLGAVVGVSNLHIYAAMRGETLDEFRKTRNAPGALYSVAGSDANRERPSWA